MAKNIAIFYWLLCGLALFQPSLLGQEYEAPEYLNLPGFTDVNGQTAYSIQQPFQATLPIDNPALWSQLQLSGVYSMRYSMHPLEIHNSGFLAAFRITPNLFGGLETYGTILPQNTRYDLNNNAYVKDEILNKNIGFSFYSSAMASYRLWEYFSVGAKVHYHMNENIQENIRQLSADVGISWQNIFSELSFGLVARNLGGVIEYDDTSVDPMYLKAGITHPIRFTGLNIYPQASVAYSEITGPVASAGVTTTISNFMSVNVGGNFTGEVIYYPWSFGVAGVFEMFQLNYTLSATSDSDFLHMVGLTWAFNRLPQWNKFGRKPTKTARQKYMNRLDNDYIPSVPAPPKNIRLSVSSGVVTITWDSVLENDKYAVYAKRGDKGIFRKVTAKPLSKSQFSFRQPKGSVPLFFYVRTNRGTKKSEPSRVVTLQP
jgi:hypothetical protein